MKQAFSIALLAAALTACAAQTTYNLTLIGALRQLARCHVHPEQNKAKLQELD